MVHPLSPGGCRYLFPCRSQYEVLFLPPGHCRLWCSGGHSKSKDAVGRKVKSQGGGVNRSPSSFHFSFFILQLSFIIQRFSFLIGVHQETTLCHSEPFDKVKLNSAKDHGILPRPAFSGTPQNDIRRIPFPDGHS